ncbi:MAG: hypothetical protein CO144_01940 [Candidatus Nealsonbacteria bacterium CG_4_9_14_3_um_filter_35_11]|uniref:General secretion pathway GspH domain-containing protein n=1 Tax=Candidatus Nealsonbacteria bacterium CG02_land_8_20_14_3_00_34_20 TaxID=1974698 RepID=A0A2M7DBP2_9BACT|nr:MAG: hypothetical protein COS24_00095 [Candidatus Nealsonbacteria bacterium CG02_land_8_20_14_3_00_34_20]PIW92529.1 MAG: hypothetical protein COZ88_01780 [Candidatus Nealsonbacteria bacterium CG_4_8_14_3_um_filter_34_13]PJA84392.1 MAG: hypothetical protein CO144_01940 [Candidatus Nealsonbacteria bacterium CG_4_9_14_3_um_filter_35_11]
MLKCLKCLNVKMEKGFSLIELLVVVAVIVILSTLVFSDYSKGGKKMALERAAQRLSQDIRKTQEMAMSAYQPSDICNGTPGNLKGFGIHFDESSGNEKKYIIFAECNDTEPNYDYDGDGPDDVKEGWSVDIEKGIKISDIEKDDLSNGSTYPTTLSVVSIPPDPTIYIASSSSGYEAIITLCIEDSCATNYKKIKVNNAGRIKVE